MWESLKDDCHRWVKATSVTNFEACTAVVKEKLKELLQGSKLEDAMGYVDEKASKAAHFATYAYEGAFSLGKTGSAHAEQQNGRVMTALDSGGASVLVDLYLMVERLLELGRQRINALERETQERFMRYRNQWDSLSQGRSTEQVLRSNEGAVAAVYAHQGSMAAKEYEKQLGEAAFYAAESVVDDDGRTTSECKVTRRGFPDKPRHVRLGDDGMPNSCGGPEGACTIFITMRIPCRHMLAVALTLDKPMYWPGGFAGRWRRRTTLGCSHRASIGSHSAGANGSFDADSGGGLDSDPMDDGDVESGGVRGSSRAAESVLEAAAVVGPDAGEGGEAGCSSGAADSVLEAAAVVGRSQSSQTRGRGFNTSAKQSIEFACKLVYEAKNRGLLNVLHCCLLQLQHGVISNGGQILTQQCASLSSIAEERAPDPRSQSQAATAGGAPGRPIAARLNNAGRLPAAGAGRSRPRSCGLCRMPGHTKAKCPHKACVTPCGSACPAHGSKGRQRHSGDKENQEEDEANDTAFDEH